MMGPKIECCWVWKMEKKNGIRWICRLMNTKKKQIRKDFDGTFDKKQIKYKVISVPKDGEGAVMKYGDESDWHVEDGVHFPHIPPPLPESRLPSLLVNTQVSYVSKL